MSDSDYGKKLVEEMWLDLFLAEYKNITGRSLMKFTRSERPDFLCTDFVGDRFGIELVRVMETPESHMWRRVLKNQEFADPLDTAIRVQETITRKDYLRQTTGWSCPDNTILVLQLMDAPIEEVKKFICSELFEVGESAGFSEIWIADYTVEEAYSTVQLYGIKPERFRGLHDHAFSNSKPYG